jgi:Na+-translocating ferredoxin:NAD+ oxidoreductase RnfG subunit
MHVRWLLPVGLGAASVAQIAQATQYLTVEQAQRAAFPSATAFVAMRADFDATASGTPAGWSPRIWQARNGDTVLGWFFADAVIGKSEQIIYSVALDANGAVLALEVLEYREAHGGEVRLAPWRKQFVGKTAHDPLELNRDIKNISGATLSCRHLTEGVQRLLKLHERARWMESAP